MLHHILNRRARSIPQSFSGRKFCKSALRGRGFSGKLAFSFPRNTRAQTHDARASSTGRIEVHPRLRPCIGQPS